MAVDPPTVVQLGTWSDVEFAQIPEFNGGYTNRVGIVDDKPGIRTRANASWPRFQQELWDCVNQVFRGDKTVPGIGTPAESVKWRPGDDGAQSVNASDIFFYSVPFPQVYWTCNQTRISSEPGLTIETNITAEGRVLWSLENQRSGVDVGTPFFQFKTYGIRSTPNVYYHSSADVDDLDLGGELTVCGTFNLSLWNQANNGVIFLSHRRYDVADETGIASRLGWEIGLTSAFEDGSSDLNDMVLYYRDRSFSDSERKFTVRAGSGIDSGSVHLPWNREHHICFQRYLNGGDAEWHVRVLLNGIEQFDISLGATVNTLPGNSPNMRVLFGSNWDGNMNYGGATRNVMIWTDGQTHPTPAQIRTLYQVGAGFLPKGPPPA